MFLHAAKGDARDEVPGVIWALGVIIAPTQKSLPKMVLYCLYAVVADLDVVRKCSCLIPAGRC